MENSSAVLWFYEKKCDSDTRNYSFLRVGMQHEILRRQYVDDQHRKKTEVKPRQAKREKITIY